MTQRKLVGLAFALLAVVVTGQGPRDQFQPVRSGYERAGAQPVNYQTAQAAAVKEAAFTTAEAAEPGGLFTNSREFYLSLAILLFGLLTVALETVVITRSNWNLDPLKIIGLTLVLTGCIFLISAGYNDRQIAPVIGLLGTIAGYILGREGAARLSSNK